MKRHAKIQARKEDLLFKKQVIVLLLPQNPFIDGINEAESQDTNIDNYWCDFLICVCFDGMVYDLQKGGYTGL